MAIRSAAFCHAFHATRAQHRRVVPDARNECDVVDHNSDLRPSTAPPYLHAVQRAGDGDSGAVPEVIASMQNRLLMLQSIQAGSTADLQERPRVTFAEMRGVESPAATISPTSTAAAAPAAAAAAGTTMVTGSMEQMEERRRLLAEEEARLVRWEQELAQASAKLSKARHDAMRLQKLLKRQARDPLAIDCIGRSTEPRATQQRVPSQSQPQSWQVAEDLHPTSSAKPKGSQQVASRKGSSAYFAAEMGERRASGAQNVEQMLETLNSANLGASIGDSTCNASRVRLTNTSASALPIPESEVARKFPGLSRFELSGMWRAFQIIDIDGNGTIDSNEFSRACRDMSLEINDMAIQDAFNAADTDQSGAIDFSEFVSTLLKVKAVETEQARCTLSSGQIERCQKVYRLLNNEGSVGLWNEGVSSGLSMLGLSLSHDQTMALCERFDTDGNRNIHENEFVDIYACAYSTLGPKLSFISKLVTGVQGFGHKLCYVRQAVGTAATSASSKLCDAVTGAITDWRSWRERAKRKRDTMATSAFVRHMLSLPLIMPDSKFAFSWSLYIMLCVLYSCILIPTRMGMGSKPNTLTAFADIILELTFLCDLYVNCKRAYVDPSTLEVVTDEKMIRRKYLRGWFLIDCLSSIPMTLLSFMSPSIQDYKIFSLLRALKMARMVKLLDLQALQQLELRHPTIVRMGKIAFSFLFILHFIACSYWAMVMRQCVIKGTDPVKNIPHEIDPFCPVQETAVAELNLMERYAESFYWAILALIGNGETKLGNKDEFFFASFILLVGIVAFSAILGSASALLASMDVASMERQNELNSIEHFLRGRKVAPDLRARVAEYFKHQWDTGTTPYHRQLFNRIPRRLASELHLSLRRRLIEAVPMFSKLSPLTALALIRKLKSISYMPGEVVVSEGADADCMYFIAEGSLKVSFTNAQGSSIHLVDLCSGSYFGELAFLGAGVRSATVTTTSYCELERLSYRDVQPLLHEHPDLLGHIVQAASVRVKRLRARFKTAKDLVSPVSNDVDTSVTGHGATSPSTPQAAKQVTTQSAYIWSRVTASALQRKSLFGIMHKALLADLEVGAISDSVLRSVQRRQSLEDQTAADVDALSLSSRTDSE